MAKTVNGEYLGNIYLVEILRPKTLNGYTHMKNKVLEIYNTSILQKQHFLILFHHSFPVQNKADKEKGRYSVFWCFFLYKGQASTKDIPGYCTQDTA